MSKTKRYHIGECDCDLCRFYDNGYEQGKSSAIKEVLEIIDEMALSKNCGIIQPQTSYILNRLKAKLQEKR